MRHYRTFSEISGPNFAEKNILMKDLPVSKKFYADILERIDSALGHMCESKTEAVRVVDVYLREGVVESGDGVAMIVFNMIRVELDRAMERSRRARERARARRESNRHVSKEQSDKHSADILAELSLEDASCSDEIYQPAPLHLSRRERRAAAKARKKARWKSLE